MTYKNKKSEYMTRWNQEHHERRKEWCANYRAKDGFRELQKGRRMRYLVKDPRRNLLSQAKYRAKIKNIPFDITIDDIYIPMFCPVLKTPLRAWYGRSGIGKPGDSSPSIDRLKPGLGYVKGNVCVISWRANTLKHSGTAEEHESIARYMKIHA